MREYHDGESRYKSAAQAAAVGYSMGRERCSKKRKK